MQTQNNGQSRNQPKPNHMPAVVSDTSLALPGGKSFMPSEAQWKQIKEMGGAAQRSGMLPAGIKSPEAAAIIGLKAYELGVPLMEGFAHIHVINGKPTISRELMQTLVYQNIPGAVIEFTELRHETTKAFIGFRADGRRPGRKPASWTFTMEDAKVAGLLSKPGPWQQYPQAMCLNRAISALCRAYFPDGLRGCSYTPEELEPAIPTTGRHLPDEAPPVEAKAAEVLPPEPQPADEPKHHAPPADPVSEAEVTQPADKSAMRLTEIAGVIDKEKWPNGSVLRYCAKTFKTSKMGELSDFNFQMLMSVVRNSSAADAMGEFDASTDARA